MMLARLSTKSLIDMCVGWSIINVLQFLITDKKTYRPFPIMNEGINRMCTYVKTRFFPFVSHPSSWEIPVFLQFFRGAHLHDYWIL